MSDDQAEQAWVRSARAGSADAFSRLVRLHQQALRLFLRRLGATDPDDLAQETFVRAWDIIARFDPERSFRAWLFGIGWRKYRESKRGWLRRLIRDNHYAELQDTAIPCDAGTRLDLAAAMAALAPDQRAAVALCLAQDFTHAEAAEALDMPLGTVKSHVARGREKLKALLGDSHG